MIYVRYVRDHNPFFFEDKLQTDEFNMLMLGLVDRFCIVSRDLGKLRSLFIVTNGTIKVFG